MKTVKGNGNIVSKEIQVSSFVGLRIDMIGTVRLVQSDIEKVVVETDENLQCYFDAQNANGKLFVYAEIKLRNLVFTKCEITIFLCQINSLDIHNIGDMVCDQPIILANPLEVRIKSIGNTQLYFEAPAVKLANKSLGDVTLTGRCENIQIENSGLGDFIAKELIVNELVIKNKSIGNIELYANKAISIGHSGVGAIGYWGDAVLKSVKYGTGQITHRV